MQRVVVAVPHSGRTKGARQSHCLSFLISLPGSDFKTKAINRYRKGRILALTDNRILYKFRSQNEGSSDQSAYSAFQYNAVVSGNQDI
jgi:hypothetical protein